MSIAPALQLPRFKIGAVMGAGIAALALSATSAAIAAQPMGHQGSAPAVTAPSTTTDTTTTTPTTTSTTDSSTTGGNSANAFGQQVKQQVATCKATAATAGTHGIGACVSAWVVASNPGHAHHSSGTSTGSGTAGG